MSEDTPFPRFLLLLTLSLSLGAGVVAAETSKVRKSQPAAHVRQYFIAVEELEWDFAPSGIDLMHGEEIPFPWSIQRKWPKTRYVEYTDATFTKRKPQPEWLGILGPVIRAEVGDVVHVHFRNKARGYHSIHVHGLRYNKRNEGAVYSNSPGAAVPPGQDFHYEWIADAGSAPAPGESSRLWLYHGHVNEPAETNAGMIGPIIVTARGKAKPDGSPVDIDREFVALFMIFDQLRENEAARAIDSNEGQFHSINGYIFGNLPGLVMNEGERVRWYVAAMGSELDLHSAHWHGKTVVHHGRPEDVIPLMPAQTETVTMNADNPGTWMFQCHVADHIEAGMMMLYRIRPKAPRACALQFGEANFWKNESEFRVVLKNTGTKAITTAVLESDAVVGLNRLDKMPAEWSLPLPLEPGKSVTMQMPSTPRAQDIEGWILFPNALTFADGTRWEPNERGECMQKYWRDKEHQSMEILPAILMH